MKKTGSERSSKEETPTPTLHLPVEVYQFRFSVYRPFVAPVPPLQYTTRM
jgi:hypothetical protein